MAFVFRTSREATGEGRRNQATSKNLGPGSYIKLREWKASAQKTPFCSTSQRQIGSEKHASTTPGPGSYYKVQEHSKDNFHAWNAFKSKTKRFQAPTSQNSTPGPGSYTQHTTWKPKSESAVSRKTGKLKIVNNIPSELTESLPKSSAPSIPLQNSYGYKKDEQGNLIPQTANNRRRPEDIGPGTYSSNCKLMDRRTKGFSFAKSKGRDDTSKVEKRKVSYHHQNQTSMSKQRTYSKKQNEYPSGALQNPALLSLIKSAPKNHSMFASKTKRWISPATMNTPGPGAYENIVGPKDIHNSLTATNHVVQEFGSTSRRFEDNYDEDLKQLGPGAYNIPSTFVDTWKSSNRMQRRVVSSSDGNLTSVVDEEGKKGFISSSARFPEKEENSTPGVGSYNLPTSIPESDTRSRTRSKPSTSQSAFGSSCRRFFNPSDTKSENRFESIMETSVNTFVNPKLLASQFGEPSTTFDQNIASNLPVHRSWGEDTNTFMTPKGSCRSVFLSKTARMSDKKQKDDVPDPGTYHVEISWTNNGGGKGQMSSHQPRIEAAKLGENAPGPGSYNTDFSTLSSSIINRKGKFLTSQRFSNQAKVSEIGPGSYDTEFVHGNLLTRTYNITIAEEEEAALKKAIKRGLY